MRQYSFLIAGLMAAMITACGSPAEEPAEQVIVRKPGETAASSSAAPVAASADLIGKGRSAFAACVACHAVEAGRASGAGPNLNGIIGRAAATVKDFKYSNAMKSSGITWTEAELDSFLANAATKVPGTSMAVAGIDDAEERKAIIAYLASLPK